MNPLTIPGSRAHRIVVLALLIVAAGTASAGGKGPAPFETVVEVVYGPVPGPESFREDVEREIVRLVAEARCFRAVSSRDAGEPGADLLLLATLGRVEERTEYEISLGSRDAPQASPGTERRLVARMEVRVDVELAVLPERHRVRARAFSEAQRYRPSFGEDARYEVRRMLVHRVARETEKFACKGAAKRLVREVERVRAGD